MEDTAYFLTFGFAVSCAALLAREHLESGKPTKLYAVRDGDLVKFGISQDPLARFKNMRVANPRGISLVVAVPSTENLEKFVHQLFKAERHQGEWFRASERVKEFLRWLLDIERILATYDEAEPGDTIAWLVGPAEAMLEVFTESVRTPVGTKP